MARLLTLTFLVAVGGCSLEPEADELFGLKCSAEGNCVAGYVCDRGTRTCILTKACEDADRDLFCAQSDCDDHEAGCTTQCIDVDGDGLALCAGDCDDNNPFCLESCTDNDGDGYCPPLDCDDDNAECTTDCTDADNDGYCISTDCDDSDFGCNVDCIADADVDSTRDCSDRCIDLDADGLGNGTGGNETCISSITDSDDERGSQCADSDADGCDDCAVARWNPANDGVDGDLDGLCDRGDPCTDYDGDGLGTGTLENQGCVASYVDIDDMNAELCADSEGDSCDDCSQTGVWTPFNDGADMDGDGYCNAGDSAPGLNTFCADTDVDGCDDCFSGQWNPAADGADADGDGICAMTDCDDNAATCIDDCTTDDDRDDTVDCRDYCIDRDGDGYGTAGGAGDGCLEVDCDDGLSVCHIDCLSDGDFDGVTDCVELACGTDPENGVDICRRADGVELTLEDAVSIANDTAGHEKILVTYSLFLSDPLSLQSTDGSCMSIRGSGVITVGAETAFNLIDDDCLVEGLTIAGGRDGVLVQGDNARVMNNTLVGWLDRAAVRVEGNDAWIENNTISGVDAVPGDDDAGIVVAAGAERVVIVGNLVFETNVDGIQLRGATHATLDHNTLWDNPDGLEISGAATTDLCLRNNLFVDASLSAIRVEASGTTFRAGDCTDGLVTGPIYGNGSFNNGAQCDGVSCGGCACLPTGTFWSHTVDPLLNGEGCVEEPSILNSVTDLGYDRNGAAEGRFEGSAPEPGARERGAGICQ